MTQFPFQELNKAGSGTQNSARRLDIHSHLIPMVDDGCQSIEHTIECVQGLKKAGFAGSVCTPHVWPDKFPENTIANIRSWTADVSRRLKEAGVDYQLWPGGEVRLFDGVIQWMEENGVPTLAGSRCVLVDMWTDKWPKWAIPAFKWLLENRYQPILAHPERMQCLNVLEKRLSELKDMGVWLQGNFRCMTGEEGFHADQWVRRLLHEGRYHFMASDLHRPSGINGRLDGMQLIESEFGPQKLDQLTIDAPKRLILARV